MEYYMIINGTQVGPYSKDQLLSHGLTPSTPVWKAGMGDWRAADTIDELRDLFSQSEESAYAASSQSGPQPGPYRAYAPGQQRNQYQGPTGVPHTNWMPWAIVATVLNVCSCIGLVFGIIGIVHASKANNFYAVGDDIQGDANNNTAKIMTIIGLVLAGLGIIGNILYFVLYGAAVSTSLLSSGFLS